MSKDKTWLVILALIAIVIVIKSGIIFKGAVYDYSNCSVVFRTNIVGDIYGVAKTAILDDPNPTMRFLVKADDGILREYFVSDPNDGYDCNSGVGKVGEIRYTTNDYPFVFVSPTTYCNIELCKKDGTGGIYFNAISCGSTITAVLSPSVSATEPYSSNGQEVYSDPSCAVEIITVPATPTGLTCTATSSTSITCNWNVVSGAVEYRVYRSTSSSGSFTFYDDVINPSAWVDSGPPALTPSTTYYYKVTAVASGDVAESPLSSYVSATTQSGTTVPATPTGLTATPRSSSQIVLRWNSVSDTTEIKIYSSDSENGTYTLKLQVGGPITSVGISQLKPSTTYYFKISAINSAGESNMSSFISATTLSLPVTATCSDGIKNQDETDIDCGGSICSACPSGGGGSGGGGWAEEEQFPIEETAVNVTITEQSTTEEMLDRWTSIPIQIRILIIVGLGYLIYAFLARKTPFK